MSRLATCLTFVQGVIIGSWKSLPPVWLMFRWSSSVHGRACHLFRLCRGGRHQFMAGLATCLTFVQAVIIGSWQGLPPVWPMFRSQCWAQDFVLFLRRCDWNHFISWTTTWLISDIYPSPHSSKHQHGHHHIPSSYIYIYIYIFLWGGSKMKVDITKFNNMADIIC